MIIVPDASVAVKWYIYEDHTSEADKFLDGTYELHAPELLLPEFANIICKKVRRSELTTRESSIIINAFNRQDIIYHPHRPLFKAAYIGAEMSQQAAYDWSYLALAISLSCELVTADERFYNALKHSKLTRHLVWLGNL